MSGMFAIGRDAELRHTPSGSPVCTLSLAYNFGQKDAATGRRPSQWIEADLWGDRARALVEYLLKGRRIFAVLEDVHTQKYTTRDQAQGFKMVARIGRLQILPDAGNRTESTESAPRSSPPAQQAPAASRPRPQPAAAGQSTGGSGFDDMDDDIPF